MPEKPAKGKEREGGGECGKGYLEGLLGCVMPGDN